MTEPTGPQAPKIPITIDKKAGPLPPARPLPPSTPPQPPVEKR